MNTDLTLEGIRKGSQIHYKKCYNHFYRELVVYANSYLYDTASSEDVVQEVFLYLWENARKMQVKTCLRSYLYAMVRNRCLNILKSIKITDNSNFLELKANLIAETNMESSSIEDKTILYDQVLQVLDTMPMGMQKIFKMKFVNDYKYNEIAEELGISVNTVKTQLKRARLKFGELVAFLIFCLLF